MTSKDEKKMNIIFLDIDGVLNCQLYFEKERLQSKNLNELIGKLLAKYPK